MIYSSVLRVSKPSKPKRRALADEVNDVGGSESDGVGGVESDGVGGVEASGEDSGVSLVSSTEELVKKDR